MVDSSDNEVRLAVGEEVECHFDTINGCAGASIYFEPLFFANRFEGQRMSRGDGTSKTRARTVRSHDKQVSVGTQGFNEKAQSGSIHAVVVGKKEKRTHDDFEKDMEVQNFASAPLDGVQKLCAKFAFLSDIFKKRRLCAQSSCLLGSQKWHIRTKKWDKIHFGKEST